MNCPYCGQPLLADSGYFVCNNPVCLACINNYTFSNSSEFPFGPPTVLDTEIKYNRRRVTISFQIHDNCFHITDEELAEFLDKGLKYWDEGRYDFFVEQMAQGLQEAAKTSIFRAIGKKCQQEYPGFRITFGPDGRARGAESNWGIAEGRVQKDVYVSCRSVEIDEQDFNKPCVTVTTIGQF